jgi:hypothetical protein
MLTPTQVSYLCSMSDHQLVRLFNNIFRRIGWGWDHPTLRAVYPQTYAVLTTITLECQRRLTERNIGAYI